METGWQFVTATSQDQLVSILHMTVKPCGLAKVLFERGGMIQYYSLNVDASAIGDEMTAILHNAVQLL